MSTKVALVRCASYDRQLVEAKVREAVGLLGGIANFVRPGSRVLLKPNLLMAKPPESGIDTHPEVVRAMARLLKEINCELFLGDGPSCWGRQAENTDFVYAESGMQRIAEEEGIRLVGLERRTWRRDFPLSTFLAECDHVVNLPKFKTHELMILTGAVKNLFGLVPSNFKTEIHRKYFQLDRFASILVDIYQEVKPSFSLVDGIIAMEGDGPGTSGTLRECGVIVAGQDAVALDSILAVMMGLSPLDILTNKEAAGRGLGSADLHSIEVIGDSLGAAVRKPFKLPMTSLQRKALLPILNAVKNFVRFYPQIERAKCVACGACVQVCPQKVIRLKSKFPHIRYSGCISCFCCQESCPESAIGVKKTLLAKMLGL